MKSFQFIVFIFICLITSPNLIAQNIGIHAEPVGEWTNSIELSPEYHYNSVAVYLLNEGKLSALFDPENFSSKERKEMGLRKFDEIESLYFSLQIANPIREGDSIVFPLYAFDIKNTKSFSIPRNQGKIIDKITDEELNGKGLEARARIEVINKNTFLEVAYQLSSSLNRILEDRIFNGPSMLSVIRKARNYFESKYRGKIVSEFNIPILPGNEDYEYILNSASLYQVKWNFQPTLHISGENVWSGLENWETVSEEDLRDKPTRLSKLKQHPYLLVLRYKSAYSLPEDHKLNVQISDAYLQKRLYNLTEFKKGGNQYRIEEAFLGLLRDAIDLKRNCEDFRREKEKGNTDNEKMVQVAQQYFDLLKNYEKEVAFNNKEEKRAGYFKDNYEVTYYKFFKLMDNVFFMDEQLKETCRVADYFRESVDQNPKEMNTEALYDYLKKFDSYRNMTASLDQVEGELFYKVRDRIYNYENALFLKNFYVRNKEKEGKIQELQELKKRFALCELCGKEADSQIAKIQQSIDDEIRSELFALQNRQLKIRSCFNDIRLAALQNLSVRYPQPDSLNELDALLLNSYTDKVKSLGEIAIQFQPIEDLSIQKLSSKDLPIQLQKFENILSSFRSEACQLKFGGLISAEQMSCLEEDCEMISP
ncbi:MAG: hypothetical protein NXI23_15595 [Bacteroidetes bacterium]|nr:hypothetical protein [Bacteroidota bacterium]